MREMRARDKPLATLCQSGRFSFTDASICVVPCCAELAMAVNFNYLLTQMTKSQKEIYEIFLAMRQYQKFETENLIGISVTADSTYDD